MNDELDDTPSVLAVGARLANLARRARSTTDAQTANADAISVTEVATGRQAMALLRVVPFDLVAVGPWLIDTSAGRFAATLRQAKPWQKWVSVHDADADMVNAPSVDEPTSVADANLDEIAARTLGATAVLEGGPDAWPQLVELARQVRRREPARTVPGLSLAGRQAELNRTDIPRPARTPAAI